MHGNLSSAKKNVLQSDPSSPSNKTFPFILLLLSALLLGCETPPKKPEPPANKTENTPPPSQDPQSTVSEPAVADYDCRLPEGLVVDAMGNGFAEAPGFASYSAVAIYAQRLNDKSLLLRETEQAALKRVVDAAIRTEWRERFAWLRPDEAPDATTQLTLRYWLSAELAPQEPQPVLQISAQLADEKTGRVLYASCKQSLFIDSEFAGPAGSDIWLQGVRAAAARWASDTGNHISAH